MRRTGWLLLVVLIAINATACRSSVDFPESNTTQHTWPMPTQYTSGTYPVPTTTAAPVVWPHEAALDRFLTQTNHEGTIGHDPSAGIQAPGTLPEVQFIPTADQSLVGSRVPIILAQKQQAIPFYYSFDAVTGAERLAVVIQADRIPMLIIFETTLGGLKGLCEKIAKQEPFEATILSTTNISIQEGNYAYNAAFLDENEEMIDIWSESPELNSGIYLGLVGADYKGNPINILKGAEADHISQELQTNINVYLRIFNRFDLMKFIEA